MPLPSTMGAPGIGLAGLAPLNVYPYEPCMVRSVQIRRSWAPPWVQCAPASVLRYTAKLTVVAAYNIRGFTGSIANAVMSRLARNPVFDSVQLIAPSVLFMTPLGVPAYSV